MNYLSVDEIISINQVVVDATGGSIGIREQDLLESIAHKPTADFGGVVNYHAFIDGNKRTGFASMARFLYINGYRLKITDQEIEDYTIFVATTNPDLQTVTDWIEKHANLLN